MNVTDGDRDKAAQALWPLTRYRWPRDDEMTEEQRAQWDRAAAALAEERERARAPFLALADEYERHVGLMDVSLYDDVIYKIQSFEDAAASIRRAAEETTE